MYGNVRRPKKSYETDEDAIRACMRINQQDKQIHKVVAYRCIECGSFHVGKTRNVLSAKDKKKCHDWLTVHG